MRTDYGDDDLEDDLEDDTNEGAFDDNGVLKDGRKLKVTISMMDSLDPVQRSIAAASHRPGFRHTTDSDDTRDAAEQSRDEYVRWLKGAHRAPTVDGTDDAKPKRRNLTLDAARADAEQARLERDAWLRDAWKQRPKRKRMPWGWAFGDEANGA